MTKADVAEVLGVCTKTVEAWERARIIPPGQRLGAFVFWHPLVFYAWLDRRLKGEAPAHDAVVAPAAVPSTSEPSTVTTTKAAAVLPPSVERADQGGDAHRNVERASGRRTPSAASDAGRRALERSASLIRDLARE
ncbi:helix-turn-helix transcriptional regulator [Azohydromonas sediminis]|uniref:helix-turn-helix transcriptional regulator n=1 Tax=Azohydromonas sediminis TaxID=2259674 RepID=UPI0013C36BB2|nr:helix-turn-helix domain-containing protein [Azohydromonas sediminis]